MEKSLKDVIAEIKVRLNVKTTGNPNFDHTDVSFIEMLERRGDYYANRLIYTQEKRKLADDKVKDLEKQLAEMTFMFAKSFNRLENDKKIEVIEAWESQGAENDYIDETIQIAAEQIHADETHGPAKYFENAFHISYPSNKKGGK